MRFSGPYTRISAVGTASGIGIFLVVGGMFLVHFDELAESRRESEPGPPRS